jgi:hypothetical protein
MPRYTGTDGERRLPRAVAWVIWLAASLAGWLVVAVAVVHVL